MVYYLKYTVGQTPFCFSGTETYSGGRCSCQTQMLHLCIVQVNLRIPSYVITVSRTADLLPSALSSTVTTLQALYYAPAALVSAEIITEFYLTCIIVCAVQNL